MGKFCHIRLGDRLGNLFNRLFVISVGGLVATLNRLHPNFPLFDQPQGEGGARRIA